MCYKIHLCTKRNQYSFDKCFLIYIISDVSFLISALKIIGVIYFFSYLFIVYINIRVFIELKKIRFNNWMKKVSF